MNKVERNCDMCLKHKKPKLKPVVGHLLFRDFYDVTDVDQKEMNNINLFYTAHHATQI